MERRKFNNNHDDIDHDRFIESFQSSLMRGLFKIQKLEAAKVRAIQSNSWHKSKHSKRQFR